MGSMNADINMQMNKQATFKTSISHLVIIP